MAVASVIKKGPSVGGSDPLGIGINTNAPGQAINNAEGSVVSGAGSVDGTTIPDGTEPSQIAAKSAADALDPTKPASPAFTSIQNPNGSLESDYTMSAPSEVQASKIGSGGQITPGSVSFKNIVAAPAVGFKSIQDQAKDNYDAVQLDQRGMDAMRERSLSTDLDPTTKAAMDRQRFDEQNNVDLAQKGAAGATAAAAGSIGMRGGLGGGAQERIAASGAQNAMDEAQNVHRQGSSDRLGLEGQDAGLKANLLSNLPSAELAWAQPAMHKADVMTGIQGDERNLGVSTDMANRDYTTNVDKTNSEAGLDVSKTNVSNNMEGQRFNILNSQDVAKTNATNKLNADEFNYNGEDDAAKTNIANKIGNVGAENNFNIQDFLTKMGGWGAGKTADATAAAGNKPKPKPV